MLVLSRKKNETLIIGGGIRVTVIEVKGGTVRLGIAAPAEVSVHRQEVLARILAESQAGEASAAAV